MPLQDQSLIAFTLDQWAFFALASARTKAQAARIARLARIMTPAFLTDFDGLFDTTISAFPLEYIAISPSNDIGNPWFIRRTDNVGILLGGQDIGIARPFSGVPTTTTILFASRPGRTSTSRTATATLVTPPPPPTIQFVTLNGQIATVFGLALPFATVDLFADGSFTGTATAGADGSFVVNSDILSIGVHALTATQTDPDSGLTSDPADAGTVNVVLQTTGGNGGLFTTTPIQIAQTTTQAGFGPTTTASGSGNNNGFSVDTRSISLTSSGGLESLTTTRAGGFVTTTKAGVAASTSTANGGGGTITSTGTGPSMTTVSAGAGQTSSAGSGQTSTIGSGGASTTAAVQITSTLTTAGNGLTTTMGSGQTTSNSGGLVTTTLPSLATSTSGAGANPTTSDSLAGFTTTPGTNGQSTTAVIGQTTTVGNGQTSSTGAGALETASGPPGSTISTTTVDIGATSTADLGQTTSQTSTPTPPAAPLIGSTSLNGNIVTVNGTGEPNALIELYSDGVLVGNITAGSDGSFSVSSSPLDIGSHNITVTQTTSFGTSSPADAGQVNVLVTPTPTQTASTTTEITTSTSATATPTPPGLPIIGSVGVNGLSVTVNGTAEPNATVNLFSDGVLVGNATAGVDGSFSVTSDLLALGSHNITLTQTTSAGTSGEANAGLVLILGPVGTTTTAWSETATVGFDLRKEGFCEESMFAPNLAPLSARPRPRQVQRQRLPLPL